MAQAEPEDPLLSGGMLRPIQHTFTFPCSFTNVEKMNFGFQYSTINIKSIVCTRTIYIVKVL